MHASRDRRLRRTGARTKRASDSLFAFQDVSRRSPRRIQSFRGSCCNVRSRLTEDIDCGKKEAKLTDEERKRLEAYLEAGGWQEDKTVE